MRNAEGQQAFWHYDSNEQIIAHTGFDGRQSRFEYNASGWPTALHLPGDQHRLIEQKDPLGRQTFYAYGADGQLTGITDPQGGLTQWQHNARGQLTERTDCSGRTERYHYDAYGWLSILLLIWTLVVIS